MPGGHQEGGNQNQGIVCRDQELGSRERRRHHIPDVVSLGDTKATCTNFTLGIQEVWKESERLVSMVKEVTSSISTK